MKRPMTERRVLRRQGDVQIEELVYLEAQIATVIGYFVRGRQPGEHGAFDDLIRAEAHFRRLTAPAG